MKSILNRIAIALLVTSLASIAVFAKTKTETIKFVTNIKVNGTLVNKGTYDLKFDDQTNEVTVVKNNKVIARAPVTVEKREQKARAFSFTLSQGNDKELIGVTFFGADHNVVVRSSQASN